MSNGHWEFHRDFNVGDWYGFTYCITDLITTQQYIGMKCFTSTSKKRIEGRKNRKVIVTEAKWRNYTGSSTHLNQAIKEKGKDNFKFEILSLHSSKASLVYGEAELQFKLDVLRERLADGITPKYYNRQIRATILFIPPVPTEMELLYNNH